MAIVNAKLDPFVQQFYTFDACLKARNFQIDDALYASLQNYIFVKYYSNNTYKQEVLTWIMEQVRIAFNYRCKRKANKAGDKQYVEWLKYFIAYCLCQYEYEFLKADKDFYRDVLVPIDEKYSQFSITLFKKCLSAISKVDRIKYLNYANNDVAIILKMPVTNRDTTVKEKTSVVHCIQRQTVATCPKCGLNVNQVKAGFNASGTQRYRCKNCNVKYTPVTK